MNTDEFLKTLKLGSHVAVNTRDLGIGAIHRLYGPEIWTVTNITPSRTRFDLANARGEAMSCGRGGDKRVYEIREVTDEVLREIDSDAKYVRFNEATDSLSGFFYDLQRMEGRRTLMRDPDLQFYTVTMEQLAKNLRDALKAVKAKKGSL
jgi:hypothetical protein